VNECLPYRNKSAEPSVAATSSSKAGHLKCHQCGINVEQDKIRSHVGGHILRAKLNVHESGLLEKTSANLPCGFCGSSGCTISLQKTRTTFRIVPMAKAPSVSNLPRPFRNGIPAPIGLSFAHSANTTRNRRGFLLSGPTTLRSMRTRTLPIRSMIRAFLAISAVLFKFPPRNRSSFASPRQPWFHHPELRSLRT